MTKTFKKDFYKIYKSEKDLYIFSKGLKIIKPINLISPYKKYKLFISGIHLRGIYIMAINNLYLPIFIIKKSDKNYGNNLVVDKSNILILKNRYEKSIIDIDNDNYKII